MGSGMAVLVPVLFGMQQQDSSPLQLTQRGYCPLPQGPTILNTKEDQAQPGPILTVALCSPLGAADQWPLSPAGCVYGEGLWRSSGL